MSGETEEIARGRGSAVERLAMPLMLPQEESRYHQDAPKSVPFDLLNAEVAFSVHNQTLERLAERGGLDPREMLSLMTGQNIFHGTIGTTKIINMDLFRAVSEIRKRL